MKAKINPGDRVAYSVKFLKSISADYETAQRRGTFIKWCDSSFPTQFCRVKWDDQDQNVQLQKGNFCEADYRDDVLKNGGTLANANTLAKNNSARFFE